MAELEVNSRKRGLENRGSRDDDGEEETNNESTEAPPEVLAKRKIVSLKPEAIIAPEPTAAAPSSNPFANVAAFNPFASVAPSAPFNPFAAPASGAAIPNVFGNAFNFGAAAVAAPPATPSDATNVFGAAATSTPVASVFGFGAAATSGDLQKDEGEDDPQAELPIPQDKPTGPTLQAVQVDSGESGETNTFTGELRLSRLHEKEWAERGAGTFRINAREETTGETTTTKSRLIIRHVQTKGVLLNTNIDKLFRLAQQTEKSVVFVCVANGNPETFLARPLKAQMADGSGAKVLADFVAAIKAVNP